MTQLWATTDYPPRNGQDSNQMYSSTQLALPSYSNGSGVGYLSGAGHNHYPSMPPSYSPYPTAFVPNQNATGALMYMQASGAVSMPYQMQPLPSSAISPPTRSMSHASYYPSTTSNHRVSHHHARLPLVPEVSLHDTEEQESMNHETMRSEPISPSLDGYPNVDDFDELIRQYVNHLSPKKQDKALIHAKRAANIKAVLIDKKTTSVESAQFRFWVKKMFTLEPKDPSINARKKKICHEGKPVAIREKLFKILTRAHKQCSHGGRDKTSAQVRRVYSWVPKELISRFVKLCPTCQMRRGTARTSPTIPEGGAETFIHTRSPRAYTGSQVRRRSLATRTQSNAQSPTLSAQFPSTFQQQNRWMTPARPNETSSDRIAALEAAASSMVDINMDSPISPEGLTPAPSKFAEDPGTPYLSPGGMQAPNMGPRFQPYGFSGMHTMHDMRQSDHTYRTKRVLGLKRERY